MEDGAKNIREVEVPDLGKFFLMIDDVVVSTRWMTDEELQRYYRPTLKVAELWKRMTHE